MEGHDGFHESISGNMIKQMGIYKQICTQVQIIEVVNGIMSRTEVSGPGQDKKQQKNDKNKTTFFSFW